MLGPARPGQLLFRALRPVSSSTSRLPSTLIAPLRWNRLPQISLSASRPFHTTLPRTQIALAPIADEYSSPPPPHRDGPITQFAELGERGLVNQKIIDTIVNRMNITTMTDVQSKTINRTLGGTDTLAQAKTGTGKTLAFLVPVIQRILERDPHLAERGGRNRVTSSDIRAIIVSPTRELAEQIATEAKRVTGGTGMVVQCATGGTMKRVALQKMQYEGCHILVGTPGRLIDILSDPSTGVRAPNLGAFVLDEADRLLDDGFFPDIQRMQEVLPNPAEVDRQTLLFSATVPEEIMSVVRTTMKPDFQFVRTVSKNEVPTHEKVPQRLVECRAIQNMLAGLYELCFREIEKAKAGEGKPFKAIVYFSSTAEVSLAAMTFSNLRGENGDPRSFGSHPLAPAQLLEIHSKLSQQQRTRTAEMFRRAKSGILFSSDVTARGMDFPDVTHVIQVGLPQTRDQYVHRLGRTARAHKAGEGWTFLSSIEMKEYRSLLHGLPIEPDTSLAAATVNMTTDGQLPRYLATLLTQLGEATKLVDRGVKAKAYCAALAVYSRHSSRKQIIVDVVNEWARFGWGFPQPPMISARQAEQQGFRNCQGLNIHTRPPREREEGGFGNARGGGGGFGGSRGPSRFDRSGGGGYAPRENRYGSGDSQFGSRGGGYGGGSSYSGRGGGSSYSGRGGGSSYSGRGGGSNYSDRGSGRGIPRELAERDQSY